MRKGVIFVAVFGLLTGCGGAKPVKTQPDYSTFAKKGKEAGYTDGYRCGFEVRVNSILRSLRAWEKDTLAVYSGRQMVKEGVIKLPSVFTYRKKGQVELEVPTPEVERPGEVLRYFAPGVEGKEERENTNSCRKTYPTDLSPTAFLYYKRAYDSAYEKGYSQGYKEAFDYVYRRLKEDPFILSSLQKAELGKYFDREKFISYPPVFRDGGRVRVLKPLFKPPLSLSQVLSYPTEGKIIGRKEKEPEGVGVFGFTASPLVPDQREKRPVKVELPAKLTPKLQELGISYYIDGDKAVVLFESGREKEAFCRTYGLCGGEK